MTLLYTQGVEGGTSVHTGGRGWHYCTHRGVEGGTAVHTGGVEGGVTQGQQIQVTRTTARTDAFPHGPYVCET